MQETFTGGRKIGVATHTTDVLLFGQNNFKLNKEPKFTKVTYSDSGRYECDVTMGLLNQKASFELVVEGEISTQIQFFGGGELSNKINSNTSLMLKIVGNM